jgi:hypothetical protein
LDGIVVPAQPNNVATAKAKIIIERIPEVGRDDTTLFGDRVNCGLDIGPLIYRDSWLFICLLRMRNKSAPLAYGSKV